MAPRGKWVAAMALWSATSMIAVGCSHQAPSSAASPRAGATVRVHVDAVHSAVLRLPDGAQVDVPVGAVAGAGTLSGAVTAAPGPAPPGTTAGTVYDFGLDRPVANSLTIFLPAPALAAAVGSSVDLSDVAVAAYWDAAHLSWVPVGDTYDALRHGVVAQVSHLSLWTVLRLDTQRLLGWASDALKGLIGLSDTTAQPTCPGADQVAVSGVKVTSSSGGLVKWCAGTAAGAPIVHIANNRSFALEVDFPASWSAMPLGAPDPILDAIGHGVAHALSPPARGRANVILGPGRTVRLAVPAGGSGTAVVDPNPPAYLVSGFLYGVDTLVMTFDDLPLVPHSDVAKTVRAINLAGAVKDCLTGLDALSHHDVNSAHAVGDLFRTVAGIAVGCLGQAWKTAYGISGILGSFVVKVLLWLVDGVKLAISGLEAAVESAIYWQGYRIAVNSSQVPAVAAGTCPSPSSVPGIHPGWKCYGAVAADLGGTGQATNTVAAFGDPAKLVGALYEGPLTVAAYADGAWSTTTLSVASLPDYLFAGAGPIDGVAGDEVLLVTSQGAHNTETKVLTMTASGIQPTFDLRLDGALIGGAGITCRPGGADITIADLAQPDNGPTLHYRVTIMHDRFSGHDLIPGPSEMKTITSAPSDLGPYEGVHCPGFRKP